MSEKRFEIKADDVDSSIINITRDGEDFAWFLSDDITDKQVEKVCDLLNEQQEHITHLEDTNDNFRIKLIEDIEAMEQAEKKIGEQQATIQSLKEENRKLRNIHLSIDLTYSYGYGRYLADVRVIDDERETICCL